MRETVHTPGLNQYTGIALTILHLVTHLLGFVAAKVISLVNTSTLSTVRAFRENNALIRLTLLDKNTAWEFSVCMPKEINR